MVRKHLRLLSRCRPLAIAAAIAVFAGPVRAGTPPGTGWIRLTNTKIDDVCACTHGFPDVGGFEDCFGILSWSGGVYDASRNRLVVWGGGHNAYYGNELYALDLDDLTMRRLNDPGLPVAPTGTAPDAIANGTQANSRHTYDGIEYVPGIDRMFLFSGSKATLGYMGSDTWMFNFGSMAWERKNISGTNPQSAPGVASAYDPNTGLIFLHDNVNLYSYNPSTNTYTLRRNKPTGYHLAATIDPVRKRFLLIGRDSSVGAGRVYSFDITPGGSYAVTTLNTTGGDALISSEYPGIDYDPDTDRIVGWNGGNTVYSLDLSTNQWTPYTFPNGPGVASQSAHGTHGRWRYAPQERAFVLVNETDQDAFILRLGSGGGTPDTSPPNASTDLRPR